MNTRAWAEIDIDALTFNFKEIRRVTNKNSKIMAVVKADAYGHGAIECSKALLESGADYLAVACHDEAVQLRKAKIEAPILILGATLENEIEELIGYDVTLTVFSYEFAKKVSDTAKKIGKCAKIHIKLDTGMSRIGFLTDVDDDIITDEIINISKLDNIELEGIFSHFATSDKKDDAYALLQLERFNAVCDKLIKKGLDIPIKHMANSAAIVLYPQSHLNMIRPGIILYGFYPSEDIDESMISLKRVMSLKSRIVCLKNISDERGVSYGKTYITEGNTKIGTVSIGYADGYTRLLTGKAKMTVNGKVVDVIGRICMDQCMIDVTTVDDVKIGDEVIVYGEDTITVDTAAKSLGSITNEIVCMVAKRIPREFIKDGKSVKILNYLENI